MMAFRSFGGNSSTFLLFFLLPLLCTSFQPRWISQPSAGHLYPQLQERLVPFVSSTGTSTTKLHASQPSSDNSCGLYRPVALAAWDRIIAAFPSLQPPPDPTPSNVAPSKGSKIESIVRMETRALIPTAAGANRDCPVRYARMALLETVPTTPDDTADEIYAQGIQVLNLVVLPDKESSLPVWGADFVSLPGNKHLLFLDAQPMVINDETIVQRYESLWKAWYTEHLVAKDATNSTTLFPWGGDLPPAVQPFVSANALWTRFGPENDQKAVETILQGGSLVDVTLQHLDVYLNLLKSLSDEQPQTTENQQTEYIRYRLENDPARPMLKALYGEEWSENVLQQVLFPQE